MAGVRDADAWPECKNCSTASTTFAKLHIPNHIAMIQRSLYRASRHIAPRISRRTFITPPRQSPAFIRPLAFQPPSTRLSSRWYSDAVEAKTAPKEDGEARDASKSSENPLSPSESQPSEAQTLKTELETKNKEIIDLKVAPFPGNITYDSTFLTLPSGQISPRRRRLPQPTRPHKTRSAICSRLCPSKIRERPHRQRRQPRARAQFRARRAPLRISPFTAGRHGPRHPTNDTQRPCFLA